MPTSIQRATSRVPRKRALPRAAAGGLAAVSLGLLAWAAPAAQASQRPTGPAVPAAATYRYTFSRIAWTGLDEVIAATDSHGDLYYFWQASGTTIWHKQLVALGGSGFAYSAPSIAWTGQIAVIAALDAPGDLVYFQQNFGTSMWNTTVLAAASSGKFQAPAVTVAPDGTVLVSAGNTSGELESFTLAPGGRWAGNTVAAGRFGPSSVTTVFDTVDSAYLGLVTACSGGTLHLWWEDLLAPGWTKETVARPGPAGGYTGASIAASNADVVIAAATTTGAMDSFTQPILGSGWAQQTVASSGGPYPNPQVAWTGPVDGTSFDVITAANQAGVDYWWAYDGSGLSWNPETIAANGTQAVYANPGIAVTSSSVVITAINTMPGNVMYWHQVFGTNPWHQQVVAKG